MTNNTQSSFSHLLTDEALSLDPLKDKTIAIVGYGNQGRPQALNLRDSGLNVIVGARVDGTAYQRAKDDGFEVLDLQSAVEKSDVIMCLLPDDVAADVINRQLKSIFKSGQYIGFGHGLVVKENWIDVPDGVNIFMVAPKGQGRGVRSKYLDGKGVPGLFAVGIDPSGNTAGVAKAYAKGIGCGRAVVIESTFEEEAVCDLFSEQVVLCGGLTRLIQSAFETLVEAGYSPEAAYFECLFEVKLIADLLHEEGIARMRDKISSTALFGDLTRGDRVIGKETKQEMAKILAEIQSGQFAKEMLSEFSTGKPVMNQALKTNKSHLIESVHQRLEKHLH